MAEFNHLEQCMGTVFRFAGRTALDQSDFDDAILRACAGLHASDEIFSLYKPDSPLSRLARGETSVAECPAVVEDIWQACEAWEIATDGWFKAFTPQHTFDPSGLVKTWAAREAARALEGAGITDFSVNAGGVGVSKPITIASPEAGVLTVFDLSGTAMRAVATSGSAERGDHIWNPKAPDATQDELVQVTVISDDLLRADVWATAAFAEGPLAVERLNREPNLEALFVFHDGRLAGTNGLVPLFANPN
ncbi:MAG: FAD:protein FMN transferase [Microbacteriaceae bacterium]|nr:FAD:protein FMN transferase [Microbacteriaceae bacterium]